MPFRLADNTPPESEAGNISMQNVKREFPVEGIFGHKRSPERLPEYALGRGYHEEALELVIARVARFVGFPECVVKLRDLWVCPDITNIVDGHWEVVRRVIKRARNAQRQIEPAQPVTRIYVFHNGTGKEVVIRSRGAANIMCLWDPSTGDFQMGQWLCRRLLCPPMCLFLLDRRFIWATRRHGWSLTVGVSTPPFFTAHALFEGMWCQNIPPMHVGSSTACPLTWQDIEGLQQEFGSGLSTTVMGKVLRRDGMIVHDFSLDRFRALRPPAEYVKGTVSKEEEERLAAGAEAERQREEQVRMRAVKENARWKCTRCTKSYEPNQMKRIQAHTASHDVI
ncbi:hypothetical protein HDV00_000322 [Rhizophlyctis rosea]|nr:hypothetical protein HDV00_000322 [Rhizophlyctis rosea]